MKAVVVHKEDDSIRMPNGKPSGMNSIGKGWGGEKPAMKVNQKVAPMLKPAIKPMKSVVPKTKFKMNKKGVISKLK